MEKYALFSLTDKSNLEVLLEGLSKHDYKFIATTSTAITIRELGYEVKGVEDITNFPEMLDGRVKTLQPEIAGGILADLSKDSHLEDLKNNNINPISLVVCNLYAFKDSVAKQSELFKEGSIDKEEMDQNIIEHIDIGGITLLRASSKNYRYVSLLSDPSDYNEFVERLNNNQLDINYRQSLACKGFKTSATYDCMIADYYMDSCEDNTQLLINAPLKESLRYGENPHQSAAYYEDEKEYPFSLNTSKVLQGKQLSYNNLLDIEAAYQTISVYQEPCAIALKHNTPCGAGFSNSINEAYDKCFKTDSISIFGGVVILNRKVDATLATTLTSIFLEIVIAPEYSSEALEIFKDKKNLRVIQGLFEGEPNKKMIRSISGGYLVQEESQHQIDLENVTTTKVDDNQASTLKNLYLLVKNVKSNAIVVGNKECVLGISGGMVSRVDAVSFALNKAVENEMYQSNDDLFLASDGFFPFNDIIDYALKYNVKYIIQPGGSINDERMIEACDEHGIGMLFTHIRYFKH
ncbi:MAG: bifunctional phosphoribosylaminoimidazolecarboxamide formyltransferase/IMP cyclohydrolase [Erysipelotrichales bacterium]